jgi:hypothetical protein
VDNLMGQNIHCQSSRTPGGASATLVAKENIYAAKGRDSARQSRPAFCGSLIAHLVQSSMCSIPITLHADVMEKTTSLNSPETSGSPAANSSPK